MANDLVKTLVVNNNSEGKNEIIRQAFNDNLKEVYKNMNIQQKALIVSRYRNLNNTKKDLFNFIKSCEEDLKKSGFETIEIDDNGLKTKFTIVKGGEREEIKSETVIDWDKVEKFAKEHNFKIPMTERVIIEPQLDKEKIQLENWFQSNISEFSHEEKVVKKVKTYSAIR